MQISSSLPALSATPSRLAAAAPAAERVTPLGPAPASHSPRADEAAGDGEALRRTERLIQAARAQAQPAPPLRRLSQAYPPPSASSTVAAVEGQLITADEPWHPRLRQPPALQAFMQVQTYAASELVGLGGRLDIYA